MKKLAATLCLAAVATGAFAQGTVNFSNPIGQNISTNATTSGGGVGITANAANGFYYGLFIAPSTVTTIDSSLQALFTPTWTFTGVLATNSATAGRLAGGTPIVPGWAPASFDSYLILGWSANIGADWGSVSNLLNGASFGNNAFAVNGSLPSGNAFIGGSTSRAGGPGLLPFGEPGGTAGTASFPTLNLFGTASTGTGTPASPFSLFQLTAAPEPTSMALAGLGLAAGLILRRRK